MKKFLFPLLFFLCCPPLWGQGVERNASPVLSGNARPIAGAHVWVCTGVVGTSLPTEPPCTPAASIYTDYYLMQPITQPLITDGFGNYDYFGVAGVYTECITGTMISPGYCKVITLGGGVGGGTLTNFSAGTLPPLFTTAVSNPTTTPSLAFILTNAPPLTVFGNSSSSTGLPTYYQLPQTFTTSASETASLPNSRQWVNGTNTTVNISTPGQISIDASGGGGSCATGLSDTWVLSVHPMSTCYGSANFTWDDGASKQNMQAGVSNTIGGGALQFQLGASNVTCNTSGISGCTTFYALGANNNLESASGHSTDTNLSNVFVLGTSNTEANAQKVLIGGDNNTVTADGNVLANNMVDFGLLGFGNSATATDVSSAGTEMDNAYSLGFNANFSATGGGSVSEVLCLLRGCDNGPSDGVIATNGGSVNVSMLAGKASKVSADGAGTNSSSFYSIGEGNTQTAVSGCNAQDNYLFGESDVIQCQSGLQATSSVLLGFANWARGLGASVSKVFEFGENINSSPNSITTGDVFGIGANLVIRDCTYCFSIGHAFTNTTSSSIDVGLSTTPEIVVTPGQIKFNAPLVMDPSYIQNVAQAFASLPTCDAGHTGSFATVNNSTTNQFGATITGSGSNKVGAYCNGTNWTVSAGGATGGTGTVTTTGSPLNTYLAGFSAATSITGTSAATLDGSGNLVANSLTASALTVGNCVQTTTGGLLTTAAGPCGVTSGTLTSTGSPASGNLAKFSGATSLTNGDLSGDVTTAGTLASTVVALRSLPLPTLAAQTGFLYDNAGTLALSASASNLTTGTLPCAQEPARTGDTTSPSGSCVNTTVKINGGSMPASATVLGSNSSSQPVAATLQGNGAKVQLSTGSTTTNDCVKFDVNGNTVDAGAGCSSGAGTVTSVATTAPITGGPITTTGTIACATCVVASAPGAGIPHFAGGTQTVTSSPISLSSDVSGLLPPANGGTGISTSTSTGVPQVSGGAWSVSTALANGTTCTTQTPLSNDTKCSTNAYADAAVAAANPMTTIGDRIGGGSSGVRSRVAAGLTGQVDTAVNGSTGGFSSPGVAGRTVSGTTDTILGDSGTALRDRGTTIQYTSSSSIATALPQAGSSGFSSNFIYSPFQTGSGTQTITPATSTINGQTTLQIVQNAWCSISSPDNTNYLARCANYIKAGTGLTPTYNADGSTTLAIAPSTLTTGTSVTLSAPRQYFVCTSTCTVTVPVPAAGYEFCVMNDDNVSTVITLAAIGSSARYENITRTAYGTAGTGTLVSGGAAGDKVCLLGRDSTHYLTVSYNGSWTAN